jgi:Leucine-rich repeat (LRR) protein
MPPSNIQIGLLVVGSVLLLISLTRGQVKIFGTTAHAAQNRVAKLIAGFLGCTLIALSLFDLGGGIRLREVMDLVRTSDPLDKLRASGWAVKTIGPNGLELELKLSSETALAALQSVAQTQITDLRLTGRGVTNIAALKNARNLTRLTVQSTDVKDASPLASLDNLSVLSFHGTPIKNIEALAGLRQLTWLDLSDTWVSDITPLANLKALTYLSLSLTPVRDIQALQALDNLSELHLSYTKVSDISVLRRMKSLREVSLRDLEVGDVSDLVEASIKVQR